MNYRHSYHAGNFSDVFKHVLLIALVQSFLRKDTSFCYLETHAGLGSYDLLSPMAQKNPEYLDGIMRIVKQGSPPELVQTYLDIVKQTNPNDKLRFYPGSPQFVRHLLRQQDRMILSELHPEDSVVLKQFFKHDRQVAVHQGDGYQSLKAFLPPMEKRGLVLIDPPYEKEDEWKQIEETLHLALKRWSHGMYAIWYPIKNHSFSERFHMPNALCVELNIYPLDVLSRLNGCGLIIINPPWKFDQQCNTLLPWICDALSPQKNGSYKVRWLD